MTREMHENSIRSHRYNSMKGQVKMARKNIAEMVKSHILPSEVTDAAVEALLALELLESRILRNKVVLGGGKS